MENLLSHHLDMPFYAEKKSGFSTASLGNPLGAPIKPKKSTRVDYSTPVAPAPTQKVLEAPLPLKPRIDYSKTPTPPTVIVVAPDGSINGIPTVTAQAPVMAIPLENSANKTASGGGGGGGGAGIAPEQSNEEGVPAEMGWFGMNPMQTKIAKGLTITLGLVAAWKYGLFGKLKTISK